MSFGRIGERWCCKSVDRFFIVACIASIWFWSSLRLFKIDGVCVVECVEHAGCSVRELGFEWVGKCSGVVVLSWFLAKDSGVVGFAGDSVGTNCSESMCSGVLSVLGSRDVVCDDSV